MPHQAGSTGGATGSFGEPNEGLSFADKVALAAHDNTEEKELYLKKVYGDKNVRREWGKDGDPQLVVTKGDRQIYVTKDGFGFLAETAANIPELAGMSSGAALGAEVGAVGGPVGAGVGALAGAGIGAMTGHSIKEGAKAVAGTYDKTPEQLLKQTGKEGIAGVEGEAGGAIIGKGVSKLLGGHLPDFLTGATDKSRAMTGKAWEGGALPPYASVAPDARKLARIEVDAEKLTGKYARQDDRNQAYILSEVRGKLEKTGMPAPHVDALMEQLKDPNFAFSGREAGEVVQKAVQAQGETLEHAVKTASDEVDKHLTTRLANIDHVIDSAPAGELAEDVAGMIKTAKAKFSAAASENYDKIDKMLGGKAVVPVEDIREAARQITSLMPKAVVSSITKEMATVGKEPLGEEDAVLLKEFGIELPPEGKIPLKDAQRIRTVLRDKGDAQALTRGVVKGDHLYLANAVDRAITRAGEDPAVAPAINALRRADEFYKDGIAKFHDTTIKQIVKSVRSGMPPDPEKIAATMLQPGQSAKVATLRKIVGEDTWKRVQSADLTNTLKYTSSVDADGKKVVDGTKLLDYLRRRGSITKTVHGEQAAADLEELGKELAARKGELTPESLAHGNIRAALHALKIQQAALDHHLKSNLLAELADPKQTGEKVYQWIVQPGQETRVMEVARQFGENSEQMKAVRQAALEELARNASLKAIDAKGNGAIVDAMNGFTKRQQQLLFPNGLAEDIRKLGETIKFIFPFKSGAVRDIGMAGMHAGAVLEQPLKQRLYKQAVAAVTRMIVLHPTLARWVVMGRDPNTPWIKQSAQILSGLTRAGTLDTISPPDDPAQDLHGAQ